DGDKRRSRSLRRRRALRHVAVLLVAALAALLAAAAKAQVFSFTGGRTLQERSPTPVASGLRTVTAGRSSRSSRSLASRAAATDQRQESSLIPTAQAPFLTASEQPLLLSPDGSRTARFELGDSGMMLRVEAAPSFGPQGSAVATARDVIERVTIIPKSKLGIMGVRDLFWLDDRCFLITGYEGPTGRFYGWVADLRRGKATLISMPSLQASLFVPAGPTGLPMLRRASSKGFKESSPEVLLGFTSPDAEGSMEVGWSWYSVDTGDVVDAQEDPELPTSLWREAVVSKLGILEAVMLINGTVQRRTPEGWRDIGTIQLAAEG
ncbi:unnamed protein product, partial [Polarella glacialis]